MKRKAVMTALALALVAGVAWAAAEGMSVQVRQAQVRSQPNFLASVVGTLDYGQRVQYSVFECIVDPAQWAVQKPLGLMAVTLDNKSGGDEALLIAGK